MPLALLLALAIVGTMAWESREQWLPASLLPVDESDDSPSALDALSTDLFDWSNYSDSMQSNDTNAAAFLSVLAVGEVGTTDPSGYRTLVGGGSFDSFASHPALAGWSGFKLTDAQCRGAGYGPGCVSTAAGRYQINLPTYRRLAPIIGVSDFTPDTQDRMALQLITEKGALSDVLAGRVTAAASKVRKIWASLPGAGYGQREVSVASLESNFTDNGGTVA